MVLVGQSSCAVEAVRLAREQRSDVLILEAALLDMSSMDAVRCIIAAASFTRVLILTDGEDERHLHPMLQLKGGGEYLKTAAAPTYITEAIRTVARGDKLWDRAGSPIRSADEGSESVRQSGPMTLLEKDQLMGRICQAAQDEIAALIQSSFHPEVCEVLRHLSEYLFDAAFDVNAIIAYSGARRGSIYGRFKDAMGQTIHAFQETYRMRAATCLLRYQELEIYTIAYRVGYEHCRTFRRAFKRYVGYTPSVYREKMS